MQTPVLDFISSPWVYVCALSLPLGLAMAACLIVGVFSDDRENPRQALSKVFSRDNRLLSLSQFSAIAALIGVVDWLLWIWLRVPSGNGSPALAAMSVWGFGFVAGVALFGIGIIGLHIASRSQK